jgi:hypothetical protein
MLHSLQVLMILSSGILLKFLLFVYISCVSCSEERCHVCNQTSYIHVKMLTVHIIKHLAVVSTHKYFSHRQISHY